MAFGETSPFKAASCLFVHMHRVSKRISLHRGLGRGSHIFWLERSPCSVEGEWVASKTLVMSAGLSHCLIIWCSSGQRLDTFSCRMSEGGEHYKAESGEKKTREAFHPKFFFFLCTDFLPVLPSLRLMPDVATATIRRCQPLDSRVWPWNPYQHICSAHSSKLSANIWMWTLQMWTLVRPQTEDGARAQTYLSFPFKLVSVVIVKACTWWMAAVEASHVHQERQSPKLNQENSLAK